MSETRAEYKTSSPDNDEYEVKDASRSRFTIIPNVIFKSGLSVYAVRLYCELKMIAGENGKCWVNTENLATRCGMATGSVSASKKELEERGFINIVLKTIDNRHYHEITIIDIWELNSQEDRAGSPHELAGSPGERINIQSNNNIPKTRTTESYKQDLAVACAKGMIGNGNKDLGMYPEDTRPILEEFCELWKIRPPAQKTQKAFWIEGGRELQEACGEFGVNTLKEVRHKFEQYMATHNGIAPFTVSSPRSLVNPARAEAALMRTEERPAEQNAFDLGASEVYIGGIKYVR